MARSAAEGAGTAALGIIATGVVIYGLVVGSSFLIPLVVAFILANIIEAMIERLERLRVPTSIAYLISIASVGVAMVAIGSIVADQIDAVAQAWPNYARRFGELTTQLANNFGEEARLRISERLQEFEIARRVPELLGSAGGHLVSSILVLLYVVFLLAERGLLAKKLATLLRDQAEPGKTEKVLESVSAGVRRYLWIKTMMSILTAGVSYGVFVWVKLDFAETWALLVFLLNYIPSIGSVIGVIFPALLALIQFDTYYPFLVIAVVLTASQFTIGNILEPMFMGRFLNLSTFVILVSLTFWSTIWGVVGAFLSVPITVVLLIVCANLKSLRWVAVLLSSNGRISPDDNGAA